ncbi:MAG: hypothetical protein KA791_06330 [Flavobacteriales bacterium]|nr:hypothetical protein [Flavobacteriales bacterium]
MDIRSASRLALLASIGPLFFGCSTDLDVTAPYKEITVVYSLLNKNDAIHWVKINKAFLGDGDAFVYAQVADSTEYKDGELVDARIERVNSAGTVIATMELHDTILTERPAGLFTWPVHKMYYFRGDLPDGHLAYEDNYRVVANAKGNQIQATTPIVNNVIHYSTTGNPATLISFKQVSGYQNYPIKWETTANGRRYEAYYRFHYDEVMLDGTVYTKSFDNFVGTVISASAPGQVDEVSMNGELFFQTVNSRVRLADESQVQRRVFRGMEFFWWVAAADLHTYLQLANPISGIVEERPDFSNISGGYGLLSSRMFHIVPTQAQGNPPNISLRKRLNEATSTELEEGQYTGTLHFCVPADLNGDC